MSELSLDRFTSQAKTLIGKAQSLADSRKHREVSPIHFLSVALTSSEVIKLLELLKIQIKDIKRITDLFLNDISSDSSEESYLSNSMIDFLKRAEKEAGKKEVALEHLMQAFFGDNGESNMKLLQALGLSSVDVKNKSSVKDVKKESSASIYLNNLTTLARNDELDPVIGRDNEVRRLIQILGRRNKNHPILVGDAGVGKRSIVNSLAVKIASGNVSAKFSTVEVIHLDANRLVAGVKQRGDVDERMKKMLASIRPENTILYIHGIESLFNQGSAILGAGDLVSSLLAKENLRLITSTTPEGFKKLSDKDVSLMSQLTPINIEHSTDAETIEILRGIAFKYEKYHNVMVGEPAITSAVKLAKRYLQKRALPDSAIDLIDEAASRKKFEIDGLSAKSDIVLSRYSSIKNQLIGLLGDEDKASIKSRNVLESELQSIEPQIKGILSSIEMNRNSSDSKKCILTEEDIADVLESWTGIPTSKMVESESAKLGKMEDIISSRVIGQDEAVKAISKAVRRSRLGLRDLGKPIGSFLFLGSSGVGKTEIAKALAKFLFDSEKSMIRIDMSEMGEKHMIQRLIGAPPGYAQADEGGMLTEAVMKNPYSVILLDEIEKAHPDVFNILLQILDDGRLTDGRGRTADFTNTVVIMTSNIGSKKLLELPSSAFDTPESIKEVSDGLQTDLREYLRPEVLNRISQIVIFNPLSKQMLNKIADIQIKAVEKMLIDKEIKLKVSEEAKQFLIDDGFLPQYGARPLKRAVERHIQDELAERIMLGTTKDGDTVNITFSSGKLYFQEN